MLMKILAASALTIGLATSALAQNASTGNAGDGAGAASDVTQGSGQTVVVPDNVDPNPTYSIGGGLDPNAMSSNADRNCPASPQGAMPDASQKSPGTVSPTVNDNHCGK
ncbi:hypothetical protein [Mesorhizobium sp. M00.F.Ca.ET.216.01.1.1]|uniref:hypothetical protein n=1 Tax=Mesorhizobium sp. M00.F.Ca.ET.216.01.1.1 TaxID=2500528 RepID=UPI000FD7D348|nr:hypothetical protein [Mesorhizobium sp. M00.F.Ca.ET.216.01.1.1]TGQ41338.1 hypothetical protein EN859_013440 [Mesorhizobium sp. M00.F.Ca.ET.216.01.1.1]